VALLAVVLATANLVGGFVVTDRMLEMSRGRRGAAERPPEKPSAGGPPDGTSPDIKADEDRSPEGKGSVR
jgi:NAD(P) transhydrogenase subunit alpha